MWYGINDKNYLLLGVVSFKFLAVIFYVIFYVIIIFRKRDDADENEISVVEKLMIAAMPVVVLQLLEAAYVSYIFYQKL